MPLKQIGVQTTIGQIGVVQPSGMNEVARSYQQLSQGAAGVMSDLNEMAKAEEVTYHNRLTVDIHDAARGMALDYKDDPTGFNTAFKAYAQQTLGSVPKQHREWASALLDETGSRQYHAILGENLKALETTRDESALDAYHTMAAEAAAIHRDPNATDEEKAAAIARLNTQEAILRQYTTANPAMVDSMKRSGAVEVAIGGLQREVLAAAAKAGVDPRTQISLAGDAAYKVINDFAASGHVEVNGVTLTPQEIATVVGQAKASFNDQQMETVNAEASKAALRKQAIADTVTNLSVRIESPTPGMKPVGEAELWNAYRRGDLGETPGDNSSKFLELHGKLVKDTATYGLTRNIIAGTAPAGMPSPKQGKDIARFLGETNPGKDFTTAAGVNAALHDEQTNVLPSLIQAQSRTGQWVPGALQLVAGSVNTSNPDTFKTAMGLLYESVHGEGKGNPALMSELSSSVGETRAAALRTAAVKIREQNVAPEDAMAQLKESMAVVGTSAYVADQKKAFAAQVKAGKYSATDALARLVDNAAAKDGVWGSLRDFWTKLSGNAVVQPEGYSFVKGRGADGVASLKSFFTDTKAGAEFAAEFAAKVEANIGHYDTRENAERAAIAEMERTWGATNVGFGAPLGADGKPLAVTLQRYAPGLQNQGPAGDDSYMPEMLVAKTKALLAASGDQLTSDHPWNVDEMVRNHQIGLKPNPASINTGRVTYDIWATDPKTGITMNLTQGSRSLDMSYDHSPQKERDLKVLEALGDHGLARNMPDSAPGKRLLTWIQSTYLQKSAEARAEFLSSDYGKFLLRHFTPEELGIDGAFGSPIAGEDKSATAKALGTLIGRGVDAAKQGLRPDAAQPDPRFAGGGQ